MELEKGKGRARDGSAFLFSLTGHYQHFRVAGIQVLSPFADEQFILRFVIYSAIFGAVV
jgi:hypothetical protein